MARAALHAFIEEKVGGQYFLQTLNPSVNGTASKILPNNFERMAVTVINTGPTDMTVMFSNGVTTTNGILLGKNGGGLSMSADEDLALVGWEMWAVTAGSSTTAFTAEVIRFAATGTVAAPSTITSP